MLKETLLEIFERDIGKLKEEINLYKDERSIWLLNGEIKNTAGNLCLHLTGNLNHFIGTVLGNTGFVRNRDGEFALKDVPRNDLIKDIDNTISMIKNVLGGLSNEDFPKEYPVEFMNRKREINFVLIHLLSHFNYHLGQVNYHRRLVV